jgi:hypothetical protein
MLNAIICNYIIYIYLFIYTDEFINTHGLGFMDLMDFTGFSVECCSGCRMVRPSVWCQARRFAGVGKKGLVKVSEDLRESVDVDMSIL